MWDIGKSRLLDQTDLHLNLSLLIMQPCLSRSAFLSLFHLENDSYNIFFTGIVIRAVVRTKVEVLSTGGCWGQFNFNRNPQFGVQ